MAPENVNTHRHCRAIRQRRQTQDRVCVRVDAAREGISVENALSKHKVRDPEQYRSDAVAHRTSGINVAEFGVVRTDQLHFKTSQATFPTGLFKLWPQLPEDAVIGDDGLYAQTQCWSCHCEPAIRNAIA